MTITEESAVTPPRRTLDDLGETLPLITMMRRRLGWSDEYLKEVTDPSHATLQNTDEICKQLHRIRTAGQQIVVLPDFDMDGITSGVLGWAGLNEMGFDAELYVPDHRRGHDIAPEALDEIREQFPDAAAVITCDGGINSWDGIARGQELGLTMLVTDHHVELPPGSNADVAINPARIEEDYANPHICGAMVFHQVLTSYMQRHAPEHARAIYWLRLFAGIGTVSDVMPIIKESRKAVVDSASIARLLFTPIPEADLVTVYDIEDSTLMPILRARNHSQQFIDAMTGFATVLKGFRAIGKLRSADDIDEGFYGFFLAPTFNSIRRVDADMADAFGVFTESSLEDKETHLERVFEASEKRKELTETHMERLEEIDQPYGPYISITDAPAGMLGLMASRISSKTGQPAIVLNHKSLTGSARAPIWFPVVTSLTQAGFAAVGHEGACGVQPERPSILNALKDFLDTEVPARFRQAEDEGMFTEQESKTLFIGGTRADVSLDDLDELTELSMAIDALGPFGEGFRRPTAQIEVNLAKSAITVLGSEENHLRIVAPSGLKMLWWKSAERYLDLLKAKAESSRPTARFIASIETNVFMGEVSVQAIIDTMIEDSSVLDQSLHTTEMSIE